MSTISVYAFLAEGSGDGEYESWTTQVYSEADEYARKYSFAIIELEYEFSDSSLVADYRPIHEEDEERDDVAEYREAQHRGMP